MTDKIIFIMNNIYLLNDFITNGFRIEFVDIIYLVIYIFWYIYYCK